MRNLFNFLVRYYFIFLFLLLETLSVILVARTHQHQRAYFLHSGNLISGFFYQKANNISSYFSLKQVNQQLAEENARLMELSANAHLEKDTLIYSYQDTLYMQRFTYLNARVINNSVTRRSNYLTLNKGSKDGIGKDMGVITPNGVVGIVNNVSENFSTVISMLHEDMQISVKLKKNDHIGTMTWEGGDYRRTTLSYIPGHVELEIGDTIVTSGYSVMFPQGILIGTISDFRMRRGDTFFTADIALSLDYNKLSYVFVVNDLMGQELEALEGLNVQ